MFRSVKVKNIYVTVFSLVCLAVFVLVCFFMMKAGAPDTVSVGGEEYSLRAESEEDVRAFIGACGYDDAKFVREHEITVPKLWNETYEKYQELQKAQGFDLEPYRGKPARELAYSAKEDETVYVLVCDGRIIAAHICDISGGDMGPLTK